MKILIVNLANMVGIDVFIIAAKEALLEKAKLLLYKQSIGSECLLDRISYQVSTIYLDILQRRSVFTRLNVDRQNIIINCLRKSLNINLTPNLETMYYGTQALDESYESITI